MSFRGATSSFRRACLKSQQPPHQTTSHHHPLQCRALELCFNVALNRLPTTTPPPPLIHSHHHQPSLSNALIAALKRAQAHQRRGCIEQQQQQQQPLLTIKVELEHLIISILDDPSVSRVMREAGFSSTAVKNHIEEDSSSSSAPNSVFQCYNSSGGVFSSPCSPSASDQNYGVNLRRQTHFLAAYASHEFNQVLFTPPKKAAAVYPLITTGAVSSNYKDDIKMVLDILLRKKKRNCVIVGDSVSLTEGLVGELQGRLERSEVPDELKSTQLIRFFNHFTPVSLRSMERDEVEMKLLELKRKVETVASSGGAGGIFYLGDLKWTVEEASSGKEGEGSSGYNPVDDLVSGIGKLFSAECCGGTTNAKVWLMATATYQTYMRCQMRQTPLETQWALQAFPVPSAGGLGLSLHASSVLDSEMIISKNSSNIMETKLFGNKEQQDKLNCCEECASNYEKEAQFLGPGQKKVLPFWLQSYRTEAHQKDELNQLKRKWNKLCQCLHQSKQPQNHWSKSSYGNNSWNGKIYPHDSSSSISFANNATIPTTFSSNLIPQFQRQQSCTIEFNFSYNKQATEPVLSSLERSMEGECAMAI